MSKKRNDMGGAAQALVERAEELAQAFEAGARAERARVLEQARISLFQWPIGSDYRRGLEHFRRELDDQRVPLPEYKPEGA